MYVYGLESGAYGVVEGEAYPAGKYSTNNILMVKTIFGNFKSGEAIRDEANNTKRIAKDNTISHFTVPYRGGNYATCLLYTSPSPRDRTRSRMPSSA